MVIFKDCSKKFLRSLVTLLIFWTPTANAEVIFEGYNKIMLGSKHVGFAIQRYELDPRSKKFKSTYFVHTNQLLGNAQESLTAVANDQFQPLSYQYTFKNSGQIKTIDAKFQGRKMSAMVSDGKKANTITKNFEKGIFLSTFLRYLLLNNGFKKGKNFKFSAIAEEEADAFGGNAKIGAIEKVNGVDAYKVNFTFKGSRFESFLTGEGQEIKTVSSTTNISNILVASPAEATKGFKMPMKTIKTLFGGTPTGKNILKKSVQTKAGPKPSEEKNK